VTEARKHAAVAAQRELPGVQAARVWDPDEKQFQRLVIELARTLGWTVAHFHTIKDARRGWVTPAAADGAGFVDLVLVGRDQVLFRELKTRRGVLSVDQKAWGTILERNGADYSVWRPADWAERIITELGGKVAR
jgi:hypothetical protein